MRILVLWAVLMFAATAFSQTLTIDEVDESHFPKLSMKVWATGYFSSNVMPLRGLGKEQLTIIDGTTTPGFEFTNPEEYTRKISMALSFDISESMSEDRRALDSSKLLAKELVRTFAVNGTEFALQTSDSRTTVIQEFIRDTNTVFSKIDGISTGNEGNNFSEQLLNEFRGVINMAKRGVNEEKIAVLFTDGMWSALPQAELQRCIDTCLRYKVRFYLVLYTGMPEASGIRKTLQQIAEVSKGRVYRFGTGYKDSSNATLDPGNMEIWLQSASGYKASPCILSWNAKTGYSELNKCFLRYVLSHNGKPYYSHDYALYYRRPGRMVSYVDIEPSILDFGELPADTGLEKIVKITARVDDISFDKLLPGGMFSNAECLNCSPRILKKDVPVEFRIRYTGTPDSSVATVFYSIAEGSDYGEWPYYGCFAVTGGMTKQTLQDQLRITAPKGGEQVEAGQPVHIEWTATGDTASIDYSCDSGLSWNSITENIAGNTYTWIPGSEAQGYCLLRVRTTKFGPYTYRNTKASEAGKWDTFGKVLSNGLILDNRMIWDYRTRRLKGLFSHDIYLCPDLSRALEYRKAGTFLLDLDSNLQIIRRRELPATIYGKYSWNRDGSKFLVCNDLYKVSDSSSVPGYQVWDANEIKLLAKNSYEPSLGAYYGTWHPGEDKYSVRRSQSTELITYDGSSYTELCRINTGFNGNAPAVYTSSGTFLRFGSLFYDTRTCRLFNDNLRTGNGWYKFSFSPDDRYIAVNYNDSYEIIIYETDNFTELYRIHNGSLGYAYQIEWSPDGRFFAACLSVGKVLVYDSRDGAVKAMIETPPLWQSHTEWSCLWLRSSRGLLLHWGTEPNSHTISYRFDLIEEAVLTSPVHIAASENIEELQLDSYPNPAEGKVSVRVDNAAYEIGRIYLIDLLGQYVADIAGKVEQKGSVKVEFDTQELAPGPYFIVAETSFGKKLFPLSVIH